MTQSVGDSDVFTVVVDGGDRHEFPNHDRYRTKSRFLKVYNKDGKKIAVFMLDKVVAFGGSV